MSKIEESKQLVNKPNLNINAKAYVPKNTFNSYIQQNTMNPSTTKHTPLLQSNVKAFYPKNFRPQETKPENPIVEREYFIKYPNEKLKKTKFDYDYMLSFEKWKISSEKKLLSKEFLNHLEKFKIFEEEQFKNFPNKRERVSGRKNDKKSYYKNEEKEKKELDFKRNESNEDNMKQWGRKDLTKEFALAEQFKQNLDEQRKKDPIRFDLTELLNILTVDNYNDTLNLIYEKIEPKVEYQEKFLDVLFTKAVNEKAFVFLYAKLCKELDKKLPQRVEKKVKDGKKPTSQMRSKLLDKCKEIFKIENNEKFDEYIRVDDPTEREIKLKKFVLGNVNFIGELINNIVLSKKIVFQCIENLFKRFENSQTDEQLKLINLEAIVILMDKFGTLLKNSESKMKKEDLDNFNIKIDEYIQHLDQVQKEGKIPGYIKYKIINLIERKKDNWVESKFQKSIAAKSLDEVRKEAQEAQRIKKDDDDRYSQDEVNDKIRIDLNHWKEFLEEGNDKINYDWEIVEDIYTVHKNTLTNILSAFLENCIDFVQDEKTLQYSSDYFKDLIQFYKNIIHKEEKNDVSAKAIHLIKVANDYSLDNNFIIDVWGNILYCLLKYEFMRTEHFNKLKDIGEEELKCIFTIFYKVGENDKKIKNHLDKLKLVQDNYSLYSSIGH